MSGTGIDVAPNLTTCPVPVLMLYQLTEMSGTGIDVPNSPKCPVPVIPAVYTGGIPRHIPYRTHHSFYAVQNVLFASRTEKKMNNNFVVSLNLKEDEFF